MTKRPVILTLGGTTPTTSIMGGDTVDLGDDGVLVWYVEEDAEAYRMIQRKRQREIRGTIDHIEKGRHV